MVFRQVIYDIAVIICGVPSVVLRPSLRAALREFRSAFLPLADDGRPDDGVVGVTKVEALVAAMTNQPVVYSEPKNTTKGQLTSELLDPDAGRIPVVSACLATAHPGRRTTRVAEGLSS